MYYFFERWKVEAGLNKFKPSNTFTIKMLIKKVLFNTAGTS